MNDTLAEITDPYSPHPFLLVAIRDLDKSQFETLITCIESHFQVEPSPIENALGVYEPTNFPDFPSMVYRRHWNKPFGVTLDGWTDANIAQSCILDHSVSLRQVFKTWGKCRGYAHATIDFNLIYEDRSELVHEHEVPKEELCGCVGPGRVLIVDFHTPPIEYFLSLGNRICEKLFPGKDISISIPAKKSLPSDKLKNF